MYRYLESQWNEEESEHTEIRTGGIQEATITCSLTLRVFLNPVIGNSTRSPFLRLLSPWYTF
jgi:hypothetical protein